MRTSVEQREAPAEDRLLRHPNIPYVAPFLAFLLFLAAGHYLPFRTENIFAVGFWCVFLLLVWLSRDVISLRTEHWLASALVGAAAFAIWIGPDVLWPAYRQSWVFNNSLVGVPKSSYGLAVRANLTFVVFRVLASVVNVPVLEELFWRSWLMRWLIAKDFRKVPLGTYTPNSFWTVAILFASEHGAYWDVGLVTGILFNWWMVRTRSLGDCIVAHAVTNACLAVYVLTRGQWQYWL